MDCGGDVKQQRLAELDEIRDKIESFQSVLNSILTSIHWTVDSFEEERKRQPPKNQSTTRSCNVELRGDTCSNYYSELLDLDKTISNAGIYKSRNESYTQELRKVIDFQMGLLSEKCKQTKDDQHKVLKARSPEKYRRSRHHEHRKRKYSSSSRESSHQKKHKKSKKKKKHKDHHKHKKHRK